MPENNEFYHVWNLQHDGVDYTIAAPTLITCLEAFLKDPSVQGEFIDPIYTSATIDVDKVSRNNWEGWCIINENNESVPIIELVAEAHRDKIPQVIACSEW